MRGFGTDEDGLIEILCKRTVAQRLQIVKTFKTNYGKDLISEIKGETDGKFRDLLMLLMTPTIDLYVNELHNGLSRLGTDEDTLYDIMPVLSNREMREVNEHYNQKFGKTLEKKLMDDTSGGFRRLMVALANGNRDESGMTNVLSARADAQVIKSVVVAGETEEIAVNQILCQRNFEQIKLIAQEYEKQSGHTLDDAIKDKFSGELQRGLKSVLRYALNPTAFFASRLQKSMAGIGTRNSSLNRIIVTRAEIDMENIKAEFQKMYNDSLRNYIKGDTSGDYKHALYTLINEREKKE
jgi:annexin A7/11